MNAPRRGWIEQEGGGVRREHRIDCPRTRDRRPGGRCLCPRTWWLPIVLGGSRVRSGPFYGSLGQARAAKKAQGLRAQQARREAGRLRARDGHVTVRSYYGRWLRLGSERWSPLTLDSRSAFFRRMIDERFGHVLVPEVTPQMVEDWIADELAGGRGYRSVEFAYGCLRAMFDAAVSKRHIPWNPVSVVELPAPPPKVQRRDHLTEAEYRNLVAACKTITDELFVRLAGEAGLRRGEICALRRSYIDFDAREITVHKTVVQPNGSPPVEKLPKAGKPRIVSLTTAVCDLLASYTDSQGIHGDDLLFRSATGDRSLPYKPMTVRLRVQSVMVRAGLVREDGKPAFTLHDLRRTAATLARERGVPAEVIRDQLGHHITFITQRHYLRNRTNPRLGEFAAALDGVADAGVPS